MKVYCVGVWEKEVLYLWIFWSRVYCVNMVYSQFVIESDLSAETLAFNSLRMENNLRVLESACRDLRRGMCVV